MTIAVADRLSHRAVILEMNVESYRYRETLNHIDCRAGQAAESNSPVNTRYGDTDTTENWVKDRPPPGPLMISQWAGLSPVLKQVSSLLNITLNKRLFTKEPVVITGMAGKGD